MSEMVALAGLNDLVDTCLLPSDMDRFDAVCDRECPSYEQLAAFVASVVRAISERPTKRPSDSSDGSPSTEPVSTVVSSSPVIRRLQGRPDLQLMVMMAQEARATA